jgi:hypothetical protein
MQGDQFFDLASKNDAVVQVQFLSSYFFLLVFKLLRH